MNCFLTPNPKKLEILERKFELKEGVSIQLDENFKGMIKFEVIGKFLSDHHFIKLNMEDFNAEKSTKIVVKYFENEKANFYRVLIDDDKVLIEANCAESGFHGLHTVFQVFRLKVVSCMKIEDWPDIKSRGLMLDISRDRVPKMETILQLIDNLSSLKYNEFQLYVEHTFAYKEHTFWKESSPITPEELRIISNYCRERFIKYVPNQNSLGHMHRIISHKDYLHLAENPQDIISGKHKSNYDHAGKAGFSLCPTDPKTLDFLYGLYDCQLGCVDNCEMMNIGLDEAFDLYYSDSGKSQKKIQQTSVGVVYMDFLISLNDYLEKRGVRVQFWADMIIGFTKTHKRLPKNAIPMIWGYEGIGRYRRECPIIAKISEDFYVCPATSSWNTWGGRTTNMLVNISEAAVIGHKYKCCGLLLTIWGDNGHHQELDISMPAILAGSCASWNTEFSKDLNKLKETVECGLNCHIYQDKKNAIGKALTSIGECYRKMKDCINTFGCSCLFNMLVFDGVAPDQIYLKFVTPQTIEETTSYISENEEILKNIEVENEKKYNLKKKLFWVCKIQKFSCKIATSLVELGGKEKNLKNLDVSKIPNERKKVLVVELRELIRELKEIWMLSSREGGLVDSTRRLRYLLKLLKS